MEAPERERTEYIRGSVDAMIRTMRLHHRVVEKQLDGLGVHHSQHRMLMQLSRLGRSASQKDIAEAMDVSPACVARTLKHLSAAGLIDKAEGEDSRRNEISILPAGQRLVDDSRAIFRQIGARMFDGVSAGELEQLNALLSRIQNNLASMEREAANGAFPADSDKGDDEAL